MSCLARYDASDKVAGLESEFVTGGGREGLPIYHQDVVAGKLLRKAFSGPMILAGCFNLGKAEAAVEQGRGDLFAFGRVFIANPDLPERFRIGASLNAPEAKRFFGGDAHGSIDYPAMSEE